ncbi:MAG TPA: hypothetical protein VKB79_17050 [Bryobacteraceae bacterium]|nr:hypothetical protein [Bryobacteraceae bacterium]
MIAEVEQFRQDCCHRYQFNSRWDNTLNIAGILLSVSIIAAGAWNASRIATVLGGLVASIVTAQRAFPFGQRAQFYRSLIGQSANLLTDMREGLIAIPQAVSTLQNLRLDFAQQLPRGTGNGSVTNSGQQTNP